MILKKHLSSLSSFAKSYNDARCFLSRLLASLRAFLSVGEECPDRLPHLFHPYPRPLFNTFRDLIFGPAKRVSSRAESFSNVTHRAGRDKSSLKRKIHGDGRDPCRTGSGWVLHVDQESDRRHRESCAMGDVAGMWDAEKAAWLLAHWYRSVSARGYRTAHVPSCRIKENERPLYAAPVAHSRASICPFPWHRWEDEVQPASCSVINRAATSFHSLSSLLGLHLSNDTNCTHVDHSHLFPFAV